MKHQLNSYDYCYEIIEIKRIKEEKDCVKMYPRLLEYLKER